MTSPPIPRERPDDTLPPAETFCEGCGPGAPGWTYDEHGSLYPMFGDAPPDVIPCPVCHEENEL